MRFHYDDAFFSFVPQKAEETAPRVAEDARQEESADSESASDDEERSASFGAIPGYVFNELP